MTGFHQREDALALTAPVRVGTCTPFPFYISGVTQGIPGATPQKYFIYL